MDAVAVTKKPVTTDCGRAGGEESAVILPITGLRQGLTVADISAAGQ